VKRIALIRNSYQFNFGGAEIFPVSLARVLSHNNYDPYILSANTKLLSTANDAKLKTTRSPWWSFQNFSGLNLFLTPVYLLWVVFLTGWYFIFVVKNGIDLLHPQSRDDFIAATFAAKLLGKRVIWTDHGDLKYIYMNHATWYKNPVGKLAFLASKLADHVAIESFSEKKLIEKVLGKGLPNNFSVIHIGVIDSHKPKKQKSKKLILVSTSRLIAEKGIGELIRAMKLVNNTNVVLKICGDGPEANHFRKMAKGIKNIEFLGHVDDVNQVLQQSDILVHPSYHESFGLSLVEAEMNGLPIIASNIDSIPEIVKDGVSGILVPPRSIKDLANAITLMIDDPDLRTRMGKASRQLFLDNFQFDNIVREQIVPLYNKNV
jgi:glycosyltransferase involved in cell wall biosynthesis